MSDVRTAATLDNIDWGSAGALSLITVLRHDSGIEAGDPEFALRALRVIDHLIRRKDTAESEKPEIMQGALDVLQSIDPDTRLGPCVNGSIARSIASVLNAATMLDPCARMDASVRALPYAIAEDSGKVGRYTAEALEVFARHASDAYMHNGRDLGKPRRILESLCSEFTSPETPAGRIVGRAITAEAALLNGSRPTNRMMDRIRASWSAEPTVEASMENAFHQNLRYERAELHDRRIGTTPMLRR